MTTNHQTTKSSRGGPAFTLVEVVMSLAIIVLVLGAILVSFSLTAQRAEWSGYSLEAQSLSIQQLEQARAAVWDNSLSKNELTNLNLIGWTYNTNTLTGTGYSTNVLDVPVSGGNFVMATNFVTVKTVYLNGSTNPPVQMQMLIVNTVWPFAGRYSGKWKVRIFTNTSATYYGPDDRDASTL